MISAISKYLPRWLMAIIATALMLATVVGSSQDSAEAIDPADTDTVYIADGTNFADALMGATIASLNTSPMLGVAGTNGGDVIPGDTVEEEIGVGEQLLMLGPCEGGIGQHDSSSSGGTRAPWHEAM